MAADILDVIDGALADYATSKDAMRWAPPEDEVPHPPSVPPPDLSALAGGIAEMFRPVLAVVERMFADFRAALPGLLALADVLKEGEVQRRAEVSAMHREYRRRQKARKRRRRG